LTIPPQLGIGGCAPIPKKLSPLSIKIALAKFAAERTISGAMVIGRMWLSNNLVFEKPNTVPACTNSSSFVDLTNPRTKRATSTHIVKPTAINTCQKPLPNASVIAMTIKRVGIDHMTLMNHMIILSTSPPKKPANAPRKTPSISDIITATKPMAIDILEPTISRLKRSLPYLSVPKGNRRSFKKMGFYFFFSNSIGKLIKSNFFKIVSGIAITLE